MREGGANGVDDWTEITISVIEMRGRNQTTGMKRDSR